MKSVNQSGRLVSIGLVLLLLFQLNALPIHEFLLVQQGYTLVHHEEASASPTNPWIFPSTDDSEPYNVADCALHHLILVMASYLAFLGFLLSHTLFNRPGIPSFINRFFNLSDRFRNNPERAPPMIFLHIV